VVQSDERSLRRLPTPFVAHLGAAGEDGHFVLVCKLAPKEVTVLDGSSLATTNWEIGHFVRSWSGYALIPSSGFRAARYRPLVWGATALTLFLGIVLLARSRTVKVSLSRRFPTRPLGTAAIDIAERT
jgi:hypothetical protein